MCRVIGVTWKVTWRVVVKKFLSLPRGNDVAVVGIGVAKATVVEVNTTVVKEPLGVTCVVTVGVDNGWAGSCVSSCVSINGRSRRSGCRRGGGRGRGIRDGGSRSRVQER